jgi:hypothetical protein
VTDLKTQIARGEYHVDPGAVAGSMVNKLTVIKRVRRLLDPPPAAGHSRQRIGRLH